MATQRPFPAPMGLPIRPPPPLPGPLPGLEAQQPPPPPPPHRPNLGQMNIPELRLKFIELLEEVEKKEAKRLKAEKLLRKNKNEAVGDHEGRYKPGVMHGGSDIQELLREYRTLEQELQRLEKVTSAISARAKDKNVQAGPPQNPPSPPPPSPMIHHAPPPPPPPVPLNVPSHQQRPPAQPSSSRTLLVASSSAQPSSSRTLGSNPSLEINLKEQILGLEEQVRSMGVRHARELRAAHVDATAKAREASQLLIDRAVDAEKRVSARLRRLEKEGETIMHQLELSIKDREIRGLKDMLQRERVESHDERERQGLRIVHLELELEQPPECNHDGQLELLQQQVRDLEQDKATLREDLHTAFEKRDRDGRHLKYYRRVLAHTGTVLADLMVGKDPATSLAFDWKHIAELAGERVMVRELWYQRAVQIKAIWELLSAGQAPAPEADHAELDAARRRILELEGDLAEYTVIKVEKGKVESELERAKKDLASEKSVVSRVQQEKEQAFQSLNAVVAGTGELKASASSYASVCRENNRLRQQLHLDQPILEPAQPPFAQIHLTTEPLLNLPPPPETRSPRELLRVSRLTGAMSTAEGQGVLTATTELLKAAMNDERAREQYVEVLKLQISQWTATWCDMHRRAGPPGEVPSGDRMLRLNGIAYDVLRAADVLLAAL